MAGCGGDLRWWRVEARTGGYGVCELYEGAGDNLIYHLVQEKEMVGKFSGGGGWNLLVFRRRGGGWKNQRERENLK